MLSPCLFGLQKVVKAVDEASSFALESVKNNVLDLAKDVGQLKRIENTVPALVKDMEVIQELTVKVR